MIFLYVLFFCFLDPSIIKRSGSARHCEGTQHSQVLFAFSLFNISNHQYFKQFSRELLKINPCLVIFLIRALEL